MKRDRRTKAALLRELAQLRHGHDHGGQHQLQANHEELLTQNEQLIEAQRSLERGRLRYLELFDFAPVGYATLSSVGTIQEANLTLARLLGLERGRLVRRSLRTFVAPGDRKAFLLHLADCGRGEEMQRVDLEIVGRDGARIPVRLTTRANASRSLWTVVADLSEERSREAERHAVAVREAAGLALAAAKLRFRAMLSHELRTPLTPILAAASSLREQDDLPPPLRPLIEVIQRNALLEARLVDDLLDLTRIEHAKLDLEVEPVDVHRMLIELGDEPAPDARHGIVMELAATRHHLSADRLRLRQVLANLLSNARRYSPGGDPITVSTRDFAPGTIEIVIRDHGLGIARELLATLFEPFTQSTWRASGARGLGLGLAICDGIVRAHRGTIRIESEGENKGTVVTLCWPTAASLPPPAPKMQPIAVAPPRALRILLVEDDEDSAFALGFLLRQAGHEVTVVASCRDALVAIERPCDLLISDLDLPDGNGIELLRLIRLRHPLPALVLSGYGSEIDRSTSRVAGFAAHLVKPIERANLLAAIAAAVPVPANAGS